MGWFGGLVTRQSQKRTRHIDDYLVQLDLDQSTRSMKLPLEMYSSGYPDAVLGSWGLLERSTVEQMDGGGAAVTWGASRAGRETQAQCDAYRPRRLKPSEFVSVFVLNREHGCCGA